MKKHFKKIIRVILYFHLLLVLALAFTHCSFSRYAKRSYERARLEKPFDAIIVPGLPFERDNHSSVLKMRMLWAKHLYDSGFTNNIIFSGSAVYTPYVESIAMKEMADSLGIPAECLFAETEAEHSTENVYYSWKMARGLGFKKIALATDPFQSAMLKAFIKKYTPGVKVLPVVFGKIDLSKNDLPQINASSAYVADFVSIKQRETFWQRMRGTLGKRVKEETRLEARKARGEHVGSN